MWSVLCSLFSPFEMVFVVSMPIFFVDILLIDGIDEKIMPGNLNVYSFLSNLLLIVLLLYS